MTLLNLANSFNDCKTLLSLDVVDLFTVDGAEVCSTGATIGSGTVDTCMFCCSRVGVSIDVVEAVTAYEKENSEKKMSETLAKENFTLSFIFLICFCPRICASIIC